MTTSMGLAMRRRNESMRAASAEPVFVLMSFAPSGAPCGYQADSIVVDLGDDNHEQPPAV